VEQGHFDGSMMGWMVDNGQFGGRRLLRSSAVRSKKWNGIVVAMSMIWEKFVELMSVRASIGCFGYCQVSVFVETKLYI
jgi:hypothetical protein